MHSDPTPCETVICPPDLQAQMLAAAHAALPQEACGLLLGHRAGRVAVVAGLVPAPNVATDPCRHFEIDPLVLLAAHKAARAGGLPVLGCYHSHPTGFARPSATDAALAASDGSVWAIAGGGTLGWWQAGLGGFTALSLAADADYA